MSIRYPNGKPFVNDRLAERTNEKRTSFSNRGMSLEEDINLSNEYYLAHGIAVIHKKPTPVQIVKVDYPKRSAAVIKEAYFQQASTTDYNGVYKGKYIDFEAKETRNKTSFPLNNFHEHQIVHMKNVLAQNGISFVLLRFSAFDEVYLLDSSILVQLYDEMIRGRKSIPKKDIERFGHQIELGYQPRLHYMSVVEKLYF